MPIKFCFNCLSPGRAVSTRLIHYDDTTEKSCIRIVQVQLTYEFVRVRGHIDLEPFFWVCTLKLWPSLLFTSILLCRKNDLPHGLKRRFDVATRAIAKIYFHCFFGSIFGSIQSVAAEVMWTRALIRIMNPRKNSSTKKWAEIDIYYTSVSILIDIVLPDLHYFIK